MADCFVLMPFGQTTPEHTEAYWTSHFEDFIKPAIEKAARGGRFLGFKAKRSSPPGGGIVDEVLRKIQEADVVLADITDFNPNVMYELGITHCLKERTIIILEEGAKIPFYFQNYMLIRYTKSPSGIRKFNETIQDQLRQLSQQTPRPYDNPVSSYFNGIRQKVMAVPLQDIAQVSLLRQDSFSAIYTPDSNEQRNTRKPQVLREAQNSIRLLASTGHSYLAEVGNRFQAALTDRLKAGIPTQIILLNPWTSNGVLLALGELLPKENAHLTPTQTKALEQLAKGDFRGFDPVDLIKHSIYYNSKYRQSVNGYLRLAQEFGDKIELKLAAYEVSATMLLTEKTGFFEPYIHANLRERHRRLLHTLEVEFLKASNLYRHCSTFFDTLWELSQPYDQFIKVEQFWQSRLRGRYR